MKDLIISLAIDGRENYSEMSKGLEESILKHWNKDFRILKQYETGITPHTTLPYVFKFDLIQQALNENYDRIFWLDTSMRLLKNITPLLDNAVDGVVAFSNEPHPLYKYITDEAVNNLSCEFPAYNVPNRIYTATQCLGGAFGLDFTKPFARMIFSDVQQQIKLGSFKEGISKREGFIASRFDQSVLSVLLDIYRIPLLPYGIWTTKEDKTNDTFIQYGN